MTNQDNGYVFVSMEIQGSVREFAILRSDHWEREKKEFENYLDSVSNDCLGRRLTAKAVDFRSQNNVGLPGNYVSRKISLNESEVIDRFFSMDFKNGEGKTPGFQFLSEFVRKDKKERPLIIAQYVNDYR